MYTKSLKKNQLIDLTKDLEHKIHQLKTIINTAIGIAYDKDDTNAIDYLINEREKSDLFFQIEE